MSREQKITGNIQPPNKDLEILKQNFSNCFDKSGNLDFEKFKKQLSKNEINFSKESYGMDWLGKSYARLLATDETTTLLKEDETFNQKEENKNSENLLIKGDNLEVLKHLSNAY
jgi:adenine-specific DNA-methyltransferase